MSGFLPFSARNLAAARWLDSPTESTRPRRFSRSLSVIETLPESASWTPCASCCALSSSGGMPLARSCIPPELLNARSEEHTSELQSQSNLVCRLLLEEKKTPTRTCLRSSHHLNML